jgi:hypothetical protein
MYPAVADTKTIVGKKDVATVAARQELAHDEHLP